MKDHLVQFADLPWQEAAPGLRVKAVAEGNQQVRLAEFSYGFVEADWCQRGHIGYVLEGTFSLDYTGNVERYNAGDLFFIPAGEEDQHKAVLAEGERVMVLLFENLV